MHKAKEPGIEVIFSEMNLCHQFIRFSFDSSNLNLIKEGLENYIKKRRDNKDDIKL